MDIVNLVQSIKKYYNLNNEHDTLESVDEILNLNKPKHIIFICLDGLGSNIINKANYLNQNVLSNINTVFPPTTACATISLQTGLYPKEHGWIGWAQYISEYDDIVELFSNLGYYTRIKYDLSFIKELEFNKYYKDINNSMEFFPSFIEGGSETFEITLNKVKTHINNNENSFSYCYWTQPDHILHETGINSDETNTIIKELDKVIHKFSNEIEDSIIILTADHGHINTENINLEDYPVLLDCLKSKPSIEPRCTNFFIEDDMHDIFLTEVKPLLKYFDLYTKEEMKNKFFNKGNYENKNINRFLGDYILVATDKYFLSYGFHDKIGMHAGETKDELEVPLVIINKCKLVD